MIYLPQCVKLANLSQLLIGTLLLLASATDRTLGTRRPLAHVRRHP